MRITTVELYDCQNVLQACEPTDPALVLPPGETVLVVTVLPRLAGLETTFRYRYRWRPGS